MPQVTVFDMTGKSVGEMTLSDAIFGIEPNGGTLKYSDVADKIFRSNLSMIDLHMGRLMAADILSFSCLLAREYSERISSSFSCSCL